MMELAACVILALVALSIAGLTTSRSAIGRPLVYGGSLILCAALLLAGLAALASPIQRLILPPGLPWIGSHPRLDALSGVFLMLVGLGGAGISLFALGYGRHEAHPERVLPFYPAFLAGLSLVVVADDAFLFLFAWELMSLTSWALVMAHQPGARHGHLQHGRVGHADMGAGFVYLLMATFSGLALLLAFGLLAGVHGGYAFDIMRANRPGGLVAAAVVSWR